MEKEELKKKIIEELEITEYDYYVLPHSGLVPDFCVRYWDLAKLVRQYLSLK